MKIAVITDDGETISAHFGRAKYFKVFTVEDDQIVHEEMVDKPYHTGEHHDHDHAHHDHEHLSGGGHSPGKFKVITDCEMLICGGMGEHAYQNARRKGHQVYLTGGKIIDAVEALLQGRLDSDLRRVHKH